MLIIYLFMPYVQSGALLRSVVQWTGNPGCVFDLPQLFGEVSCLLNFLLHSVSGSALEQKHGLIFQQLSRKILML